MIDGKRRDIVPLHEIRRGTMSPRFRESYGKRAEYMTALVKQLHAWQFRELLYSAAVAVGVIAAVATLGIGIACAIDYCVDLYVDTPKWLRVTLAVVQIAAYAGLAFLLFTVIKKRLPSVDVLAGRAEAELPKFDHRLVTSLQLNRPGAKTAGMSRELIERVTSEAESLAKEHRLASLAKPQRLYWAAGLLMVPLIVFGIALLAFPKTAQALLLRQSLLNIDIPKSVTVESLSKSVWPSGDDVTLKFRVTGPVSERIKGRVKARVPGKLEETVEATYEGPSDDGSAIFAAKLPAFVEDFQFKAYIRDGRMKEPGVMTVVPRPVVAKITAWVQLPVYVDPAGTKRFERIAPEGEVAAHADSSVRISANFSKPVTVATLVLYGRDKEGESEKVLRRIPMTLAADRKDAEVVFDLPAKPSGYSIEAADEFGFANISPPRRGITITPDAPPRVELLDEVLVAGNVKPPYDADEIRGAPINIEGRGAIVGYKVRSPLGLSKAYVVYRINDGEWKALPLANVEADLQKVGPFVPALGVFESYDEYKPVDFYSIPSNDENEPSGLAAGGRVGFQTSALTKTHPETGKTSKLELGDRVEFYVAVYDRKPGPQQPPYDRNAPGRMPGVSESRIKQVVTNGQYFEWNAQRLQSQDRLKKLEEIQRGVFGQKAGNPKK